MMNVIALWVLLSSLGAAMVMSPEPLLVKTPEGAEQRYPLETAKEVTKESLNYASEAARETGEGLRKKLSSAAHIPGKAADSVHRRAGEAAQAVKHGSQAGLEKIGLAQPPVRPSHFEQWESGLQASKEKAASLKDSAAESAQNAKHGVEDTYKSFVGIEEEKPPTLKEKIADAFHATKDATGQAGNVVKDTAVGTGEWIQNGAHATYKSAEDTTISAKEKASSAAGFGQEEAAESADYVGNLATKIAQSVQDNINAAGGEASEKVGSAYEHAADGLEETVTKTKRLAGVEDPPPPTLQEKIEQATVQAAHILKEKGKDAAAVLPNVGQGLSYGTPDAQEQSGVGDYFSKAFPGWVDTGATKEQKRGFRNKVGEYVQGVKNTDAAAVLPNVGQGLSYGTPDAQDESVVGDYVNKAFPGWVGTGAKKEHEPGFRNKVGEYVQGVKNTAGNIFKGGKEHVPEVASTGNWREDFLNKMGIHSEEDLSNKDIVVGNVNGFYRNGVFHSIGQALSHAATATQGAAHAVGETVSETVHKAADGVRHAKDAAVEEVKYLAGQICHCTREVKDDVLHVKDKTVDEVKYIAGKICHCRNEAKDEAKDDAGHKFSDTLDETSLQAHHAYDELTPSIAGEAYTLKDKTALLLRKVSWITAAWLLSSFKAVHLFAFSSAFGSSLWVTFVSGYLLSRTIPRHQFGFVQSRVFPTYLKLTASCQAICLSLYIILHPWSNCDGAEKLQYLNLWGILMSTLANVFFLEPRATKVMFEKMKVEKEEGRGQDGLISSENDETKSHLAEINHTFHKLHGYSSIANLLSLLGMTWHLWHLSSCLVV